MPGPPRLSDADRKLLELAADRRVEGRLFRWPRLRALFRRLGVPVEPDLRGAQIRSRARALLIAYGLRARSDSQQARGEGAR